MPTAPPAPRCWCGRCAAGASPRWISWCRIASSSATGSPRRSSRWRRCAQPALIVTVDNGISSHAGVAAARARRHRGADHRSSPAGARAAAGQRHRQSRMLRAAPSPAAHWPASALRSTCIAALRRALASARAVAARRAARPRICWIWWRWAPWPTWCRSMPTTASWSRRGWRASVPGAACRASPRCWRWRGARLRPWPPSDLGLRGRAAAECGRAADGHVDRHPLPAGRRAGRGARRWRRNSMRSTPSGARSRRGCRPRRCAAVRVLRDPGSGVTRAGVCLFDADWHQGVVGPGRQPRQGATAPAGDRVCARR